MIRWRLCCRLAAVAVILLPFLQCCDEQTIAEQEWLDRATDHLRRLQLACVDPVVQARLKYTIDRYSRIGPLDVRIQPSLGIAHNVPWVPGISIDPEALNYCPAVGAAILFHEAQHDYFPYLGHRHFR